MTPEAMEAEIARLREDLARERSEKADLLVLMKRLVGREPLPPAVALPPTRPAEDIQEPVLLPRVRVRMKTPAERAAYETRVREEVRERQARDEAKRQEEKATRHAWSRVYFIQQDGGDRLVKIGTTRRPVEVRLKELQNGQAYPLVILAHAPGGRYEEGGLHDRFRPHNVTGEWFRPDAELLGYAATVGKAGVL